MNLNAKPQYGPGARREWRIVASEGQGAKGEGKEHVIAYARTYTSANLAIEDIKKGMARLDELIERWGLREKQSVTQSTIDGTAAMNAARQPMGADRRVFWKAARS